MEDLDQVALRQCPECGKVRPTDQFPSRGRRCLECRRAAGRRHYEANRNYYINKARIRQLKVVLENRAWLVGFLDSHPCVDCGEREIRVLEFDHKDRLSKVVEVSVLARSGYSLARVKEEVDRCEVRCANCHRIRTHEQRGWWGSKVSMAGVDRGR